MLRSGESAKDAREIAAKMKIPSSEITKDSVCIRCHATPQMDHTGRQRVIAGVSCEACHGASGGDDGWLNRHAVYGPDGTQRETESPEHYQMRITHCTQAGQNRAANAFRLARACFQCHLVWDERLVNTGDHPSGSDLEFVTWSMGEVRHNFHLDQNVNALVSTLWADPLWRPDGRRGTKAERVRLMYVAGQLAKLHVALANRAKATEEGDFASDMEDYIDDAHGELEAIVIDYSDDDEDEDKEYDADDLPSLQRAVNAVASTFDAIDEIEEPQSAIGVQRVAILFRKAAAEVEAAAEQFIERHDGTDLEVVDDDFAPELSVLEEQEEGVVKGHAWEP